MFSETQYGPSPDNFPSGRKNKYPFEKTRTTNVINDMRKKFNLMYGKPTDVKDESGEECPQINLCDQTSNPQKLKFTELYGKRPEFPPANMISFAEFVRRVNEKSSISTPQKRSWVEESFDGGKVDDSESSSPSSSLSQGSCSVRNSQRSWKKRYLSTEMFLHSIQEEWQDEEEEEDEGGSVTLSSGAEDLKAPKGSPADAVDVRKRKAGIFNSAFEISPEKKNRFAQPLPFEMFADEGDSPGEDSDGPPEDLNNDTNKEKTVYPFYNELLESCSQDSVYSDDSTDTQKTAFCLNNIQLYDEE